ncbi:MAG TPA: beta-ketoacyl synthase chain length factor [Chitinophagales bacterium]|nr:beta-ketoacyl synthase chain length factor [Chitinophagales bacterium]
MFYIHQSSCISHQPTFNDVDLEDLKPSEKNLVSAIEPKYENVPLGQLRRMGRALRMGVGTGMKLLGKHKVDGMLIGTANGGIEDSIMFLNQIHDYEEGRLTPTSFVQSTYNAIAGMMGMITVNHGYNATHVHRGLAFENVALDAAMLLRENPDNTYLIGGVDEISEKNHRLVSLAGWYRNEPVSNADLYKGDATGTLPGEGAAMFIVNNKIEGATARLVDLKMVSSHNENFVQQQLAAFLKKNNVEGKIDLFLQGENGDNRLLKYYTASENLMSADTTIARFKHAFGEFQTVPALALWLSNYALQNQKLPAHFIKRSGSAEFNRILIYNNYQGAQHGFMLVEKV